MIIYKAYSTKYGWSRNYKNEDGKLLFKFTKEYIKVKSSDVCVGFELFDDTADRWAKQVSREKKIADIFDEDYGRLYTNHLYQYPGKIKINYKELDNPYLFITYDKGVFSFAYSYNGERNCIPISYINEFNDRYIDVDELVYIGNLFEDNVTDIFHGRIK